LPKPGGAERSVSGRVRPSFKRAMSRRRATKWGRPEGKYNFVRSKPWNTAPSNPTQKSSRGEEDRVDLSASGSRSASLSKQIICLLFREYNHQDTTLVCSRCNRDQITLSAYYEVLRNLRSPAKARDTTDRK
jgi:hypothetical protein